METTIGIVNSGPSYASLYVALFSVCLISPILAYLLCGITVAVYKIIVRWIKILFTDIIWVEICKASRFVWDNVIKKLWDFTVMIIKNIYDLFRTIILKIIDILKEFFNISKKVVNNVVEAGQNVYNVTKDTFISVYHLGEDIVVKGIDVVEAVFNFIKEHIINVYNILKGIVENGVDFFRGVADFLNGIVESLLNII